jgi:hypothetical protein
MGPIDIPAMWQADFLTRFANVPRKERLRAGAVRALRRHPRAHGAAAWVAYLQWYLPRTRTRVTYVPATPPPPPVPDHDRVVPDATYPVRRDQTADTAVSYDTANILHSYDFSLKHVFLILCPARWSCGSYRPRSGSAAPGSSGAPGHVREDPRCSHEVLRSRELCRRRRDSSPSAPPSIVLELRLDSVFAADACYLCRRVLGSEGTTTPTGAGPARLCAAAVCSTRCKYFQ